jgi:hypothetical protein
MRGAERPAKVKWTRPFLPPLEPLSIDAARQTFLDIADTRHDPEEVNRVLALTDNMPLAISLLAHLADSEGCSNVLSSWEQETTSVVSEGFDKRSNLALSISLSLSSPRIISLPQSQDLLSLLSILLDGLSDTELLQSELPIPDILRCKTALLRTSLTYTNEHKQLKALVPIREYMKKISPPGDHFIQPLLAHFQELLEFHSEYFGNPSISGVVRRISSNISNIQNIISNGLRQGHLDLTNSIYCAVNLNSFCQHTGQGTISMLNQIHNLLPRPYDYHLEVYVMTELFNSWSYHQISNPEALSIWGLKCFEYFVDTDIKCRPESRVILLVLIYFLGRFHISVGTYYLFCRQDLTVATNSLQAALSLAVSTGNPAR